MRVLVGECATKQTIHDKLDAINDVLSVIEKRHYDEHDTILGVVKASTTRLEALECLVNGVTSDVKNLRREVDKTLQTLKGSLDLLEPFQRRSLLLRGRRTRQRQNCVRLNRKLKI